MTSRTLHRIGREIEDLGRALQFLSLFLPSRACGHTVTCLCERARGKRASR